jgi:hypothetical protein
LSLGDTLVFKRGGKVVGQVKRVLSKGGKVMTLEGTTTLTDGSRASYTSVYEKVITCLTFSVVVRL